MFMKSFFSFEQLATEFFFQTEIDSALWTSIFLQQMREAAEKKRELEKVHSDAVTELRTAQAQLGLLQQYDFLVFLSIEFCLLG